MTPLRLLTLGRLELAGTGERAPPQRRKELALLVYLARRAPRRVERDVLAEMFWGESGSERARQSLRQALSSIRELLGEVFDSEGQSLRLVPNALELDLVEFESHVGHERWEQAVGCWEGDFLAGLEDLGDEKWRVWLEAERAGLRTRLLWSLRQLTEGNAARNDRAAAIRWAERWAELAPQDEAPVSALMSLLSSAGQPAEAAARYAAFADTLEREFQRQPSADLSRLREGLSAAGPAPIGGRGLLSPDMVGRADAVAAFQRAWDRVRAGEGAVLVLEGEAGAGKTRLCAELARLLRQRRDRSVVIESRAYAAERERPFSAVRGLVSTLGTAPGASAAAPEILAVAATASSDLRERYPGLPPATATISPEDAIGRLVAEVALEQPVALLVDDAPLADPASMAVLGALARRPPNGCLIVLAGRGAAWRSAPGLADATAAMTIGALSRDEVVAMLRSMAPFDAGLERSLAERLVEEAGATPGHVRETVAKLADLGQIRPDAGGTWVAGAGLDLDRLPIPDGVQTAVAQTLASLGEQPRRIYEAAAVLGPRVDPAQLETLSGLGAEEFRTAQAELFARKLLARVSGEPAHLAFPSDAARREVLDSIPPSRRTTLLRRKKGRSPGARVAWIAGIAAVVALTTAGLWYRHTRAAVLSPGSPILVADIENLGVDSTLARALQTAAIVGLQQSGRFWLFPRSQVPAVLQRMGRTGPPPPITLELAREVAQRENLQLIVVLSVGRVDSTYMLAARLVHPVSGRDLRSFQATASRGEDLLGRLSGLVSESRKALGESGSALAAAGDSLPRVTTGSLEALKAYSEGVTAWSRGRWDAAVDWYERAIEADSSFALAWAALADYQYYQGNAPLKARSAIDRAFTLSPRLTERERIRLRVSQATIYGRRDEAIAAARELAERWPSPATIGSYGYALFRSSRCVDAIPVYRGLVARYPRETTAWLNLASCLNIDTVASRHQEYLEASIDAYRQAERIDTMALQRDNLNHEYGTVLIELGRSAAAESTFRRMLDNDVANDRAKGHRSLGLLAASEGRYRDAAREFAAATSITAQAGAAVSSIRNLSYLAAALARQGQKQEALRRLEEALANWGKDLEPYYYFQLGVQFLDVGRPDRARAMLAPLRKIMVPTRLEDRLTEALLRGVLALDAGRPAEADTILNNAYFATSSGITRRILQAQVLAETGKVDSAIAAYRRLEDDFTWGWEGQERWSAIPLRLGELAERKGDVALAREEYGKFIRRFAKGDPDLPDLVYARRRLAALQGDRAR